ncbi:MAG: diphthine synthase [Thermoplasmata archaeon]
MDIGELIFIGLGLYDEKDISVKGKELAKKADFVYSEFYTSSLAGASIEDIERELGLEVRELSRDEVESQAVPIEKARDNTVVFLTAGDPMAATTHIDLRLRAEKEGIHTRVIHSSSIFSAAPSILGVQHYKFGKTITLPFNSDRKYPESPYDGIKKNKEAGFHSLVLLDINGEEQRYMTVNEGIEVLLELEERRGDGVIDDKTVLAGLARVGSDNVEVKAGFPRDLMGHDFGDGLQCIVVFSDLHFMEIDSLIAFAGAPEEIKMDG